jgi:hypothetical protein
MVPEVTDNALAVTRRSTSTTTGSPADSAASTNRLTLTTAIATA